jgi:Tol biopolymer transport system component
VTSEGEDVVRVRPAGDQEAPSWSPDSRLLAFASTHDGTRAIYALHVCTIDVVRHTGGANDTTRRGSSGGDRARAFRGRAR